MTSVIRTSSHVGMEGQGGKWSLGAGFSLYLYHHQQMHSELHVCVQVPWIKGSCLWSKHPL